jgi:para-nitrobenzyl esterase
VRGRGLAAAAVIFAVGLSAVHAQSDPTVRVSGGTIRGLLTDGGGAAFKGIPYAEPPVGDLRWREPIPARAWTGTRDATRFGSICAQHPGITIPNADETAKEDCLFLNVWTPAWPIAGSRPVLFWIPGGANVFGGTSEAIHDGSLLARRDIVVVTINYRLGSFGFFSHPALTAESPHRTSGNQGLLDQVAALDWVRANISRFGGDPTAITIGGVSAGGLDATALLTSPLTKDKFRAAILQSGPARTVLGDPLPREEAERRGSAHTASWSVAADAALHALRAIPMATILKSQPPRPVPHLNLSVDGYALPVPPADAFASGRQHAVPAIMGSAVRDFTPGAPPPTGLDRLIDDYYGPLAARAKPLYAVPDPLGGTPEVQWATDMAFRCGTVLQLSQHTTAGNRAFAYQFSRLTTPEIQPGGNIHGLDTGYVLGTFASRGTRTKLPPIEFTPSDRALSDLMQQYWVNFVRTGDPNGPGLAAWPEFRSPSGGFMHFLPAGPVAAEGLRRAQCDVYMENVARLARER